MAINYKNNNAARSVLNAQEASIRQRESSTFTGSANDPFNAPKRDNYQTYPYDYFCVDGEEKILVYRTNKYEIISIKDFNTRTDKILSNTKNGIKLSSALLYSYDFYDTLTKVRSNGESHNITNKHKYINDNGSFNFDGKIPELNDKIKQLDLDSLPNSRKYNYIDCREICKTLPNFNDNQNGTFTLKGKGTKKNSWYQIPNTIFLDEDLAYVFGLYVSEGHLIDNINRKNGRGFGLFFSLNINELDVAEKIIKIIEDKFKIKGQIKQFPKYSRIVVMFLNKAITSIFRYLDFGINCYTKKVPDIIFKTNNLNIIKSFIVGCIIGDGTNKEYTLSYKSTSLNLIYGIKILLRLLNSNSNIHISQKETEKNKTSYNLCIYSDNKLPLLSTFKKYDWKHFDNLNSYLNRKYYCKDKIFNKVSKVEINLTKTKIVYDLHTFDGNYLLGTIWSHNSGADCKIFFGDIWVDDIITLEYNVNQSKTPIYGYASQTFDAVAKGQLIIQGTLSVAFKETGYLNIIQGIIEAQRKNAAPAIRRKLEDVRVASNIGMAKFVPRITTLGENPNPEKTGLSYSPNGTPQIIRQEQTIEDILLSKKSGTALSNQLLGEGNDKSRDFEDFAELLEDTIWGDSNGEPFKLTNKLKRVDEFDYNSNGGITTAKNKKYSDVLNIMLTFGDINDFRAEHTLVVLNDVHFVSSSMIVTPNGDPLAETYTFFAREINEAISSEIEKNMNPIKLNVGNDDIKLTKLEDIGTIEKYLAGKPNQKLFISIEAAFDDTGWSPYPGELELNFNPNKITPFIDQLCSAVEAAMNDIRIPEVVDSEKEQYIVTILDAGPSNEPINITMILEQGVQGTRSYRVISPTRSGFGAPTIFTRDDLLTDVSSLPSSLDVLNTTISSDKNKIAASIEQAAYDKLRVDEELMLLGESDSAKKFELELKRESITESEEKLANKFENLGERERLVESEKQKAVARKMEEIQKQKDEEASKELLRQEQLNIEQQRLVDIEKANQEAENILRQNELNQTYIVRNKDVVPDKHIWDPNIFTSQTAFTQSQEGFKNKAYKDSVGVSIGYGFNINPDNPSASIGIVKDSLNITDEQAKAKLDFWTKGGEISQQEAGSIFQTQIMSAEATVVKKIGREAFNKLSEGARTALVDTVYQVGESSFNQFIGTIEAAKAGDETAIAMHLENSLNAKQTPSRVAARVQAINQDLIPSDAIYGKDKVMSISERINTQGKLGSIVSERIIPIPKEVNKAYGGNLPENLKITVRDDIEIRDKIGYWDLKGYYDPPAKRFADEADISLSLNENANDPDALAVALAHELEHAAQFRREGTNVFKNEKDIPYSQRPTEIEARQVEDKNAPVVAKYFGEYLKDAYNENQ